MSKNKEIRHRYKVFERDGYECWYCGLQLDADAPGNDSLCPTLDHKVPMCRGGNDDESNLVTACRSCNCKKGRKTVDDYRSKVILQNDANARIWSHISKALDEITEYLNDDMDVAYVDNELMIARDYFGHRIVAHRFHGEIKADAQAKAATATN